MPDTKTETFDLPQFINMFSMAPVGQLDPKAAKMCGEWDGEDPVRFIRNLQDLCVRYSWGSGFIITTMTRWRTSQL